MSLLPISETLNFGFLVNLGLESCSNLLKSKFRASEIAKNDNFGHVNSPKFDFTKNLSGGKMMKFTKVKPSLYILIVSGA